MEKKNLQEFAWVKMESDVENFVTDLKSVIYRARESSLVVTL